MAPPLSRSKQIKTGLPHLYFRDFFPEIQACGLEVRHRRIARKKHRCGEKNPFGDPPVIPLDAAGPSGAQSRGTRDAPTSEYPCSLGKNGLPARSKKGGAPHGFCAQRPSFRAGQCRQFNRSYAYLAKSEGGQDQRPRSPAFMPVGMKPRISSALDGEFRRVASLRFFPAPFRRLPGESVSEGRPRPTVARLPVFPIRFSLASLFNFTL